MVKQFMEGNFHADKCLIFNGMEICLRINNVIPGDQLLATIYPPFVYIIFFLKFIMKENERTEQKLTATTTR